jgi:dihydrofolate synthase/folylpolyglutamate synthase
MSLLGQYQLKNIKGILVAVNELRNAGLEISQVSVQRGLSTVQKNTGLKGRWQILQQKPMIVCDTGHNLDGVREVVKQIQTYSFRKLWLIWGMVNDKDHHEILQLLPTNASVIATQPHLPRALPSCEMQELFTSLGFDVIEKPSVHDALQHIWKVADKEDFIFIGGSTFVVAEIPFELFPESV